MLPLLAVVAVCSIPAVYGQAVPAPAPYVVPPFQPFNYTHLYATCDGISHTAECTISSAPTSSYTGKGGAQALSYSVALTNSTNTLFMQMPVGQYNPPHNPPVSQFVTVTSGEWYVQTGDGHVRVFETGDVMFQDNTANNPARMSPTHGSGTFDDGVPCNQIITQVQFAPTCNAPCPFK